MGIKVASDEQHGAEAAISAAISASEEVKSCEYQCAETTMSRATEQHRQPTNFQIFTLSSHPLFHVCIISFMVASAAGSSLKSFLAGGIGGVMAVLVSRSVETQSKAIALSLSIENSHLVLFHFL
jgi:hypothetical protein